MKYRVSLADQICMLLRRVPVLKVKKELKRAERHSLELGFMDLQSHYLAECDITDLVDSLIFAQENGIPLDKYMAFTCQLVIKGEGKSLLDKLKEMKEKGILDVKDFFLGGPNVEDERGSSHSSSRLLRREGILEFRIRWISHWKDLSKVFLYTIVITLLGLMLIHYIFTGFDYSKIFEHISPLMLLVLIVELLMLIVGSFIAISIFTLPIALFTRLWKIEIDGDYIIGRDPSRRKVRISMHDFKELDLFSDGDMVGMVLCFSENKKILISNHTENQDELLDIVYSYLPKE